MPKFTVHVIVPVHVEVSLAEADGEDAAIQQAHQDLIAHGYPERLLNDSITDRGDVYSEE